jgi:hypothetical protein
LGVCPQENVETYKTRNNFNLSVNHASQIWVKSEPESNVWVTV